jgi:hypothetical protein
MAGMTTGPVPYPPSGGAPYYPGGGPGTDYGTQQNQAQKIAAEQRANAEYAARQKQAEADRAGQQKQTEADRVAAWQREHYADQPVGGSLGTAQARANAQMAAYNGLTAASSANLGAGLQAKGAATTAASDNTQNQGYQQGLAATKLAYDQSRQRTSDEQTADQLKQQARFNEMKMEAMRGLMSSSSNGGGGGGATVPYNNSAMLAAEDAGFARAKDRISQMGAARSNDVGDSFAARGLSGSGLEAEAMGGATNQTQGELGEFARQQAMGGLEQANQTANLNMTARGQDIAARQAEAQRRVSMLQSMMGSSLY